MSSTEDIGFVLINIDNSTVSNILFDTISKFVNNNPYGQTIIFSSKCDKIDTKNIPILHLSHAKFFSGKLVLIDIPSLIITKSFSNYTNKYFYAIDVPWTNNAQANYSQWKSLFDDTSLNIIASNKSIYDLYDICWKTPLGIAENFEYEKLYQIIKN